MSTPPTLLKEYSIFYLLLKLSYTMLNTHLHAESTHTNRLYLVDFTPQWLQLPHYCIIIIIITEKEQPRKRPDKLVTANYNLQ